MALVKRPIEEREVADGVLGCGGEGGQKPGGRPGRFAMSALAVVLMAASGDGGAGMGGVQWWWEGGSVIVFTSRTKKGKRNTAHLCLCPVYLSRKFTKGHRILMRLGFSCEMEARAPAAHGSTDGDHVL